MSGAIAGDRRRVPQPTMYRLGFHAAGRRCLLRLATSPPMFALLLCVMLWPVAAQPARLMPSTLITTEWDGASQRVTTDELKNLEQQVWQREQAFAQAMADRDFTAFARFIDDDAIFFGDATLQGKAAITEGWRRFFETPTAPFSWRPAHVKVTADGQLAHSSGPVLDAKGQHIADFNSVWRRQADGSWKVVLDKGCGRCACAKAH